MLFVERARATKSIIDFLCKTLIARFLSQTSGAALPFTNRGKIVQSVRRPFDGPDDDGRSVERSSCQSE
jgi:hypothetical protein